MEALDRGLTQFSSDVRMAFGACTTASPLAPGFDFYSTEWEESEFRALEVGVKRYEDGTRAAMYTKEAFLMRKLTYLEQMFRVCVVFCDKRGYRFDPERGSFIAVRDDIEAAKSAGEIMPMEGVSVQSRKSGCLDCVVQ